MRTNLRSCEQKCATGKRISAHENARSCPSHSFQNNTRVQGFTRAPFATHSFSNSYAFNPLLKFIRSYQFDMSDASDKQTPRAALSSPEIPNTSVALSNSDTPSPPNLIVSPLNPPSPAVNSAGIQTSLIHTDGDELTVAVLQAVSAIRPSPSDASRMTEYTRVRDHFSRDLVAALSATDPNLSVLVDYLASPRTEAAQTKNRSKKPSHWITVLPSLLTSDG